MAEALVLVSRLLRVGGQTHQIACCRVPCPQQHRLAVWLPEQQPVRFPLMLSARGHGGLLWWLHAPARSCLPFWVPVPSLLADSWCLCHRLLLGLALGRHRSSNQVW